jgi:hypothetical protein
MDFEDEDDEFEDDYEEIKAKRAKRISSKKKVGINREREQRLKAPPRSAPRMRISSYDPADYDEDDDEDVFYNGEWVD